MEIVVADDNNNIMEHESSQVVEEDLEASEDTVIKSTDTLTESTDVNTTNIDDAENMQMTKESSIDSSTELSQKDNKKN